MPAIKMIHRERGSGNLRFRSLEIVKADGWRWLFRSEKA